ncbi:hypothetical protein [Actinophytocola xanthii]|uniref:Translation initiation factor IF-2 n=1 Tax=Actinophytocola xanthii TaxID=1912961 RepID=A0A1Q8CMR4_9PSEU|nr:hypothetical protein [Actinophytocola xanthii]OLF15634.1 hypothetical protein BU204_21215 [Actinophytocola xanthii]
MSMSLDEIDHVATQRRIEMAAAGGLRALRETARAGEAVDKQVREMRERHRREKQTMDDRIARTAQPTPRPNPRPTPRAGTLSLGADEFREARQPHETPQVAKPAPDAPKPRPTLKLGARDDEPRGEPEPKPPAPGRPTPRRRTDTEGEDDLSGRTWLR